MVRGRVRLFGPSLTASPPPRFAPAAFDWPVGPFAVTRERSRCAWPLDLVARARFDSPEGAVRSISGPSVVVLRTFLACDRSRNAKGATCVSTCKNAYETPVGRSAGDPHIVRKSLWGVGAKECATGLLEKVPGRVRGHPGHSRDAPGHAQSTPGTLRNAPGARPRPPGAVPKRPGASRDAPKTRRRGFGGRFLRRSRARPFSHRFSDVFL